MQSEHPADEASFVIQRGRVLGGLEPTRAFGDARYKWPKDVGEKCAHATVLSDHTLADSLIQDLYRTSCLRAPPSVELQMI